ncbi:DNA methyltransferase [Streptomyces sp. NPDC004680]|uniref:DNA methyltransferase n=1 Tax=Streptomyces sp. NPDC004680 TaxID=3154287 RepID=UPI0033AADE66
MLLVGLDARRAISPKRPSVDTAGLADILPYYAGFSFNFAREHIKAHSEGLDTAVVLDPWNGSGTTSLAAMHSGHTAIGVDLSPAANLIAQLRCQVGDRARPCPTPKQTVAGRSVKHPDALSRWLAPSAVERFRDWTSQLHGRPPEVASLAYVSLFRALRKVTADFEGTNPTWVKSAKTPDELIDLTPDDVDAAIRAEEDFLLGRLRSFPFRGSPATLITASSSALPLSDKSVDVIVTSPPYLTRIDYGVAYSRELAVLGTDTFSDRGLRAALMGTTLIRKPQSVERRLGDLSARLLEGISTHASKASGGYYLKQAVQYLNDLSVSFDEVTRVAKTGAKMSLVVQDSYYKDLHIRLADICAEALRLRGWTVNGAERFPVKRSLTTLNKSAREYAKGEVAESVIDLQL